MAIQNRFLAALSKYGDFPTSCRRHFGFLTHETDDARIPPRIFLAVRPSNYGRQNTDYFHSSRIESNLTGIGTLNIRIGSHYLAVSENRWLRAGFFFSARTEPFEVFLQNFRAE